MDIRNCLIFKGYPFHFLQKELELVMDINKCLTSKGIFFHFQNKELKLVMNINNSFTLYAEELFFNFNMKNNCNLSWTLKIV